ncbi:maturation protein [ssRNA phage Zoerhiza.3_2]|uniref:Maturation protein n=2 Tax=Norzivirales TaxID=2842247 RepID=A0A8S5L385_9VIRU|nr:maturation protein [ssRNA phage Zoerhiza.3_2]QDH89784.1 MAG: hypothetical protein H3Rhizo37124_000004 [Leviviridae sp.]DAD52129.1 TPA_asm: maturation protein [ssRNA phage Zoerhiza.3_2]
MSKYYDNKPHFYQYDNTVTRNGTVYPGSLPLPVVYGVRSGQSVPGYRISIRNRDDATSGFSHYTYEAKTVTGRVVYRYRYNPTGYTMDSRIDGNCVWLSNWPTFSVALLNQIDDLARTKFLSKCYQKQTTFSGGIFAGELAKTVRMISSPLKSLFSSMESGYLSRLRRRRSSIRNRGRKGAKVIADTWLESVYGWAPLLADIDDGAKALANLSTYRAPVQHVAGMETNTQRTVFEMAHAMTPDGNYFFIDVFGKKQEIAQVKYVGAVKARFGGAGPAAALADFGLTTRNFLPAVWELIPYSFLADYVTNVGQCIEALSFCVSDLVYCARVRKSTSIVGYLNHVEYDNLAGHDEFQVLEKSVDLGGTELRAQSYVRSNCFKDGTELIPSLSFKLGGLSNKKVANVSALITSAITTSRLLT